MIATVELVNYETSCRGMWQRCIASGCPCKELVYMYVFLEASANRAKFQARGVTRIAVEKCKRSVG